VKKIRLDLTFIISIATSWNSLIHVVTFIHDSRKNKSPWIYRFKTKQIIYVFPKLLITKLSFTNNIYSGPSNGTKICGIQTSIWSILFIYFYYIDLNIYVIVYTNTYSPIYFLCIIIMSQPCSHHGFYTLTTMSKLLKINLSIPFTCLFYKTFHSYNKFYY
jgi:hypothetical protein